MHYETFSKSRGYSIIKTKSFKNQVPSRLKERFVHLFKYCFILPSGLSSSAKFMHHTDRNLSDEMQENIRMHHT